MVRILLEKGAHVSMADKGGWTALHISAHRGHPAVTKMLVKAKADLEAKVSGSGSAPLHMAAQEGHLEVMRVLIEARADPNSRRVDGATPLYMAAKNGHVDASRCSSCGS